MTESSNNEMRRFTGVAILAAAAIGVFATLPLVQLGYGYWPLAAWLLIAGLTVCFRNWTLLIAMIVVGVVTLLLLLPVVNSSREPPLRGYCMNNIRQLTIAVINYESVNGHFPPPYTTNKEGEKLHSWRVLILPFIEEQVLYDQIDLTKPWNHPDNLRLADQMPQAFVCHAASQSAPKFTTSYVAVTGDGTVWQNGEALTYDKISDDASKTAMLMESAAARTHWMAPFDPNIDELVAVDKNGKTMMLSGIHPGIGVIAFCDGHVQCLDQSTDANTLKAIFTRKRKRKLSD